MRRAAKRDDNEPEIVELLVRAGYVVQPLNIKGCPDLLVYKAGQLTLIEVKDGSKPPSRRRLTPEQVSWHARFKDAPIVIVKSVEDVLVWLQEK